MKTTVKFKYRSSAKHPDEGVLVLHVIHRRMGSTATSSYKLRIDEWDEAKQLLIVNETTSSYRKKELESIGRQITREKKVVLQIVEHLKSRGEYSSSDVISLYRNRDKYSGIKRFMEKKIGELHEKGRFGTEHSYRNSLSSLMRFTGGKDIRLDKLDTLTLRKFETYLKSRGNAMNTISCYMRSLRAVYNYAVSERIIRRKPENPFSEVFTGNMVTEKRAISREEIRKINQTHIPSGNSQLEFSKSLFLFSFFTRGMSYKDIISLKKEDVTNHTIRYHRQKTGQPIEIQILPCIQSIIDTYKDQTHDSDYVFPVLSGDDPYQHWKQYQSGLSEYNRNLKHLAMLTGLSRVLSSYVARHSWATIARQMGIPLSVISRGMGHESEKTTRIYIGRLDNSDVDEANKKVLNGFFSETNRQKHYSKVAL